MKDNHFYSCFLLISLATAPESPSEKGLPTPLENLPQAEVIYDYEAEEENEISLIVGQKIFIVNKGMVNKYIKLKHI